MTRVLSPAEQRVVSQHLWIVEVHVTSLTTDWPRVPEDDLRSVGRELLINRTLSYDPTRGATLLTHVYKPVYFGMLDYAHRVTFGDDAGLRALRRVAQRAMPVPNEDEEMTSARRTCEEHLREYQNDLNLRAALMLTGYVMEPRNPEDQLIDAEQDARTKRLVHSVLEQATPEEKASFHLLYEDDATLKELGNEIDRSERHAVRIHNKLKERLRRAYIRDADR